MRCIGNCIDQFKHVLTTATGYEHEISSNFEFIEGRAIPEVTGRIAIYKHPYRGDEVADRMTPVADITLTEVDADGTVEVLIEVSLPINLVKYSPPDLLRAVSGIIDQEPAINIHQRYSRTATSDMVNVAIDSIYVLEWSWEMHVPSCNQLGSGEPLAVAEDLTDFQDNVSGIIREITQVFDLAADPTR
ncbi:MAG: hypothetical protein ACM3XN_10645 [Chloroflexota bacterium]